MTERLDLTATVEPASVPEQLLEATLPASGDHRDGRIDELRDLLTREPDATRADIWVASATGESETVRALLADDPALANAAGGTRGWEPLLYLCFSMVLRSMPERREAMHAAAEALLAAGADPNVYWIDTTHPDVRETPVYGAAGVANDPGLTALLLEAGADPNDGETAYHCVEHDGVPCAEALWPHFDATSRTTALLHKLDYPDLEGLRNLLELGADPNAMSVFGKRALHQAVFRGHPKPFFDLLFQYGADPDGPNAHGSTPYRLAACSGRSDIADWLVERGASTELPALDAFVAACAMGHEATARELAAGDPALAAHAARERGWLICEVADGGNAAGVRLMLDMGWDVDALGKTWSEAAIHRAAMQGHLDVVTVLLESNADLTIRDRSYDASPLGWASHGGHREVLELLARDPTRLDSRDRETLAARGNAGGADRS